MLFDSGFNILPDMFEIISYYYLWYTEAKAAKAKCLVTDQKVLHLPSSNSKSSKRDLPLLWAVELEYTDDCTEENKTINMNIELEDVEEIDENAYRMTPFMKLVMLPI